MAGNVIDHSAHKVADTLAATAAVAAGISLTDIDHVISICAGLVAIVAGISAAWYHLTRLRMLRVGVVVSRPVDDAD